MRLNLSICRNRGRASVGWRAVIAPTFFLKEYFVARLSSVPSKENNCHNPYYLGFFSLITLRESKTMGLYKRLVFLWKWHWHSIFSNIITCLCSALVSISTDASPFWHDDRQQELSFAENEHITRIVATRSLEPFLTNKISFSYEINDHSNWLL